jgi:hypothetical protein
VPAKTPAIPVNKALLRTWITDEEDSNVAFTFSAKNNKYLVTGFCRSDGEEFEITRVKWDGKALSFIARMPSTDNVTRNVFRIRSDGELDHELTTYDVWKKECQAGRDSEGLAASLRAPDTVHKGSASPRGSLKVEVLAPA